MIDPTDLRPFKASEIKVTEEEPAYYYLKKDDKFYLCILTKREIDWYPQFHRFMLTQFSKEGRLFVRINKPWKPFE